LKQAHKRHVRLAGLRRDAASVWPCLSKKEKWRKDVLLAAHQSRTPFPPSLLFEWEQQAPRSIKQDPDIILAWLERDNTDSDGVHIHLPFMCWNLPPTLLQDSTVVEKAIAKWPESCHTCLLN
jgi:hypothetical protein